MKKLRRILFTMMAMVLFFGMAPMTARAGSSMVKVGSTILELDTYYKTDENGAVTMDGASATDYNVYVTKSDARIKLTLHNATIKGEKVGINYGGSTPLEIILQGENIVEVVPGTSDSVYGLVTGGNYYVEACITGTDQDKLTVSVQTNEEINYSYGIYTEGYLTVQGGDIQVNCQKAIKDSEGIYVERNLKVTGGNISVLAGETTESDSIGISVFYDMYVEGGSISAMGGTSEDSSYGILVEDDMEITGGTVNARGAACGEGGNSYGLYVKGNLKIENTTVSAHGGRSKGCIGLFVFEDLSVVNSRIEASAEAEATAENSYNTGILVQGGGGVVASMSVEGSVIQATAKSASWESIGIEVNDVLSIKDSQITAEVDAARDSIGILAGDVNVEDSTVKATAAEGYYSLGIKHGIT